MLAYPPDAILDYAALVEYVSARLPEGRLALIAESFSGPIATRIAARSPDRVASLVFCNSFVTPPRTPLLRFLARPAMFRIRVPERVLAYLMLSPFATPELTALFARTLGEVDPAVVAVRVRELLTVDDSDTLTRVRCPIVYLRGTHDRLVPERAVRAITAAAPWTRVVRIAAPHAILQTAPDAAWDAIRSTLPPF